MSSFASLSWSKAALIVCLLFAGFCWCAMFWGLFIHRGSGHLPSPDPKAKRHQWGDTK